MLLKEKRGLSEAAKGFSTTNATYYFEEEFEWYFKIITEEKKQWFRNKRIG